MLQENPNQKVVLFLDENIEQVGRKMPVNVSSLCLDLLKHPLKCDYYALLSLSPRQIDTERKKADVFQQKKQNYFY